MTVQVHLFYFGGHIEVMIKKDDKKRDKNTPPLCVQHRLGDWPPSVLGLQGPGFRRTSHKTQEVAGCLADSGSGRSNTGRQSARSGHWRRARIPTELGGDSTHANRLNPEFDAPHLYRRGRRGVRPDRRLRSRTTRIRSGASAKVSCSGWGRVCAEEGRLVPEGGYGAIAAQEVCGSDIPFIVPRGNLPARAPTNSPSPGQPE